MQELVIILEGDNAWPDLEDKQVIHLGNNAPAIQVAVLDGGMTSGRPSVAIRLDLSPDQAVLAETSARLFVLAAHAIEAKYPNLFED